jgi:hypothetical protein
VLNKVLGVYKLELIVFKGQGVSSVQENINVTVVQVDIGVEPALKRVSATPHMQFGFRTLLQVPLGLRPGDNLAEPEYCASGEGMGGKSL